MGDIDVRVKASFQSTNTLSGLAAKYALSPSWMFRQNGFGHLTASFKLADTSLQTATSSVPHPFPANSIGWVRFTRSAVSGEVHFYTSNDGNAWNQLGSVINTPVGNMSFSTDPVEFGSWSIGNGQTINGRIYRGQLYNGINGSLVVDFSPQMFNSAVSQMQWTSSTGEIWTINSVSSTSGYKGVLVDRTLIQFDRIDDNLISTAFTSGTLLTDYIAFRQFNQTSGATIYSGNLIDTWAIKQNSASPPDGIRFDGATAGNVFMGFGNHIRKLLIMGSTTYQIGNGSPFTRQGTAAEPNGIIFGCNSNITGFSNYEMSTFLRVRNIDSSSVRTALYGVAKDMNKGAI